MQNKRSKRWFIGVPVIAAAIFGMSFLSLGDNLIYFYTPAEAHAKAATLEGQKIKVGGMVKAGSTVWTPEQLSLNFTLSDLNGRDIAVKHTGTPPDMFKEGGGVVVEGRLVGDGSTMISHNLMVKHSEEYKQPGAHGSIDKALLEKSMFPDQTK